MTNIDWTLQPDGGTEQSAAAWGIRDLRRTLVNQASDRVSFRADARGVDASPLFPLGSTVRIRRAGVGWFEGRVVRVPILGEPKEEAHRYELAGPWWYLEDLVFQQNWKQLLDFDNPASGLTNVHRSRVVLGQDVNGLRITNGAQILEALEFATTANRPLQIGTIEPDAESPWDEVRDITCAEVVRRMLRWTPDASCAWDYTTSPPTLHVLRAASQPVVTTTASGEHVEAVKVTPRSDLQRSVIVLKYERTKTVDSKDYTELFIDKWPTDADEFAVGGLTMTLELGGGRASYQRQDVRVSFINEDSAQWWQEKLPWLEKTDNLVISNAALDKPELDNELLEGTVSAWMNRESGTVKVTATASFDILRSPGLPFDEDGNPVVESRRDVDLVTRLKGTDAQTNTYLRLRSLTTSEAVPQGLAEQLHNALSVLPYEGELIRQEEEVGTLAFAPGARLRLTDGAADWAEMDARVQIVEEHVDDGQTRVRFGPPRHLGADDLVELLRVSRGKQTTYRFAERTQGTPGDAPEVDGVEELPQENASAGGGRLEKLIIADAAGTSLVNIDSADAEENELKIREIDVCEDGVAKKMRVLASEPY